MDTGRKLVIENQLNKQLTELEAMPQKDVDRVIIHDLHGLPVKRHEGTVYKDPRDDPALGALGRDFLHSGTRTTSNFVGTQPVGIQTTQGIIDEDPETLKKKGFLTKMKDKYHNWRERKRQKKLAREQGEPTSPLSPSPTHQPIGTIMEPTLADSKKTGSWDYPDQRVVTTQATLREAPMIHSVSDNTGVTQVAQTELKSGIIHPGLIQDFAMNPQTDFLISQATASIQRGGEKVVNIQPQTQVQTQTQSGIVIDDMTRPAKNLMEGVSGAYGLAASPFQPINDQGLQKLDKRLIKNPGAIEPRGVGVDNLQHPSSGFSNTSLSNVGFSNTGLPSMHQHMPVYQQSTESQAVNTGPIENQNIQSNLTTNVGTLRTQAIPVIQGMPQSYISTASNINEPFINAPARPETQFADLQAELINKGAIKDTETIISVTPMTVEPGMAGDLANQLREGKLLGKDFNKINANFPGSSS